MFRNHIWPGSADGLTCFLPSCSSAPAPVPWPVKEKKKKSQRCITYFISFGEAGVIHSLFHKARYHSIKDQAETGLT